MTRRQGRQSLLPALILALVMGAGLSCSRQADDLMAPAVVLDTLDGDTVDLGARGDAPVVIVFFSIDNPLALDTLERLERLAHDLRGSNLGLIAVALSSERPELVRTIVDQRQFLFPVALDPASSATAAFGDVDVTPTVYVIAPDGRVVERVEGRADIAALRATIEAF